MFHQLTSSIEFQEDFIVEEIQNYFYTSSTFTDGPGSLIVGTGFILNNVVFDTSPTTPTIGTLLTGTNATKSKEH